MHYVARPRSLFNFAFDLEAEPDVVGLVQHRLFGRTGVVEIGSHSYEVVRVGPVAWELHRTGSTTGVASVDRPGMMRNRYRLKWDGQEVEISRSGLGYRMKLYRNGEPVGQIHLANLFSRRLILDVPDDLPPPAVGLLVWIVVRMRRAAASAAAAGG